jgi:hypothetical protein
MKRLWPNLHTVVVTTSGAYATIVPEVCHLQLFLGSRCDFNCLDQMHHYLGPDIEVHGTGIPSSESCYALPYNKLDGDLFRISPEDDFIEFLPLGQGREPSQLKGPVSTLPKFFFIHSPRRQWELISGESYEVVLTTHDGLWRYAIGDIVTVVGFDPTDGQPIVRYQGRTRSVICAIY